MSEDPRTDAELVRASLEDPAAFAPIFERHHGRIFTYLARRAGSEVAGDLAGEVFLIAFRQRDRFRDDATIVTPWLFGIASNVARRHARSRARRLRAWARAAVPPLTLDPDAEGRIDTARLGPALLSAIDGLRAKDREVLLLFALGDLSYPEIGEALGIPGGTVRSRLFRARTELRNLLTEIGQQLEDDEGGSG